MSASNLTQGATVDFPQTRQISLRWVISARDDLVWFIGSVLSSYLLLVLYAGGILPLLPMMAAWAIFIDAPHVFATFSRTYFDREERRARKWLLIGSLLFFLIGPAMVILNQGLIFFLAASLWAYYHLIKQHYGFMVLYKKKNHDLAPIDNALDRLWILLALWCPFALFVAGEPTAVQRLPAAGQNWIQLFSVTLLFATVATGVVWLLRQLYCWLVKRQLLNVPKYLLLLAAIPMHWAVLLTPMPNKAIAIVAILTIYHNLQYHRLIWFHNRKYSGDEGRTRYGAAALISRGIWHYLAFGVLFGLWYQLPRQFVGVTPTFSEQLTQGVSAFFWGYAFIHYFLDSKIWRVRRDPAVGRALRMSDN